MSYPLLNAASNLGCRSPARSPKHPNLHRTVQPDCRAAGCRPASIRRRQPGRIGRSRPIGRPLPRDDRRLALRTALSACRGSGADPACATRQTEIHSVIAVHPSAKYSCPPGAPLAACLDQSPRPCDYHPCPAPHPGRRRDFPATSRRFP